MSDITVLEVRESILGNNDILAEKNREELREKGCFLINLMGSPGAGKTTLLEAVVKELKSEYLIGVIEADVDSAVDAERLSTLGIKTVQLHTGGLCHLDAKMTVEGLKALGEGFDVVFVENVGNLVCPAEFDIGQALKVMVLSVPEGDDKPLKYPLMFEVSDCLLINKTDTAAAFDFDPELLRDRVAELNPEIRIITVSGIKGEGVKEWAAYLKERIREWRTQ